MTRSPASLLRPNASARTADAFAAAGLTLLIAAAHGRSLTYGLFMDDHAHYRQLQECGWSLRELTEACRLELVGGVIDLWWMPEATLRFFRPVAFGIMKLTYTLGHWNPAVMHVASLLWHTAACVLLMRLLWRLGAARLPAFVAAALLAIHPAQVATVQWIAAQSELIVTTLLLGATLCFARFRGWTGCGPVSAPAPAAAAQSGPFEPRPARWPWGLASLLLFALALGCRENAIAFPLILACVEPLADRRRRAPALALYAAFTLLIGAYLMLRSQLLGDAALPPRPYVIHPGDPEFARYVFDKACYYLLGEFLLAPCVPFGGLAYVRERPLLFYGATAAVVVVVGALCWRARRCSAGWLGPAWLIGFMLPVLPLFESPHHLYLPGVGWAMCAWVGLQALRGRQQASRWRVRATVSWLAAGLAAGVFAVTTYFYGLALDTAQWVEDQVVEEVLSAPTPIRSGDTLYFANLPPIAHYVRLAVEERSGVRDLRAVALTWAPRLLGVTGPSELTTVDDRTLEIRVADDRYFAGPVGRLVRATLGREPTSPAMPVRRDDFTVEWIASDADGISALRFLFNEPPARPGMHVFWGSRTRWAYRVAFAPQP